MTNSENPETEQPPPRRWWSLPRRRQSQVAMTTLYLTEYQIALKRYSDDPAEPRQGRRSIFLILFASVAVAIILGAVDGINWPPLRLRAIVCWEVIAVLDTLLFAIIYFRDLMKEAGVKPPRLEFGKSSFLIGIIWLANFIFLLIALAALLYSEHPLTLKTEQEISAPSFNWIYVAYLFFLFLSFLIFTLLDFSFARDSKVFKKIREYWALCLFVDGPATIAFIVLLIYMLLLHFSGRIVSVDVISGAVAMQMLIADTLYLVVASNFHHWLLANRLSKGCDQ